MIFLYKYHVTTKNARFLGVHLIQILIKIYLLPFTYYICHFFQYQI